MWFWCSTSWGKVVDCSPRLAASVREVDGVDSFLPSLLLLLPEARKQGRGGSIRGSLHWGSDKGAIEGLALFVPAWHIVLATATWDTLFSHRK